MRAHPEAAALHLFVNEGAGGGASRAHTHAQLLALDFVPALIARERERFGAYATRTMGQQLLDDLVAEEVRRASGSIAVDAEAVLLAPYAAMLPYQMMLVPRRPRARFEDDGPTGAALLHDALRRLQRRFGASPPLNLWIRTAPRGAEHFCWRIDIVPRLDGHRRTRARQRRAAQQRRALSRRRPSCATREGARAARLARRGPGRRRTRSRRSGPACVVLLGIARGDGAAAADRLAEKVRALRVFPDAGGSMNEPLGEREVLCVSQFTLQADTRRGNRPSYADAASADEAEPLYERFCASARRGPWALRRPHGGRARRRWTRHDPSGSNLKRSGRAPCRTLAGAGPGRRAAERVDEPRAGGHGPIRADTEQCR